MRFFKQEINWNFINPSKRHTTHHIPYSPHALTNLIRFYVENTLLQCIQRVHEHVLYEYVIDIVSKTKFCSYFSPTNLIVDLTQEKIN